MEAVFVMDACDREVLSIVGAIANLDSGDARDALSLAWESRFPGAVRASDSNRVAD